MRDQDGCIGLMVEQGRVYCSKYADFVGVLVEGAMKLGVGCNRVQLGPRTVMSWRAKSMARALILVCMMNSRLLQFSWWRYQVRGWDMGGGVKKEEGKKISKPSATFMKKRKRTPANGSQIVAPLLARSELSQGWMGALFFKTRQSLCRVVAHSSFHMGYMEPCYSPLGYATIPYRGTGTGGIVGHR